MDEILHLTLLYDFYGELLTEKQKQVFDLHYQDDLSLSEIGEELSISRQAVRDQLKRTEKILMDYEQKLGLVDKFQQSREAIGDIDERIEGLMEDVQKQEALVPAEVTAELQKIKDIIDKLEE